jgi:hypothetical protein
MSRDRVDDATLERFGRLALAHVDREYPNLLYHVLSSDADVRSPRALHPVFYGSMDWHSCVHGFWLLANVLRRAPRIAIADDILHLMDRRLTAAEVAAEVEYLHGPMRGMFERPYGWAWLLMLAAELERHDTADAARWRTALLPLTLAIRDRFMAFLPKATYPVRTGTHFNTAFALALASEYADMVGDGALRARIDETARLWYAADTDCQAWEPSGDDFLSSALMEAECMRRVMAAAEFDGWMQGFLPRLAAGEPATLFTPAAVSDRSDGKIAHLDGLNLSRAWCWLSLARSWADDDSRRVAALRAADAQLDASLPHVSGDYAGEHWLATFALLALTA